MARPNVRERARAAAGRERAKVTSSGADGSSVVASVAYCSAISSSLQASKISRSSAGTARSSSLANCAMPPVAERCVGSQRGESTGSASLSGNSEALGARYDLKVACTNQAGERGSAATGTARFWHSRLSAMPPTSRRQEPSP